MLQKTPQLVTSVSPPQIMQQAKPELSFSVYQTPSPSISREFTYDLDQTPYRIQTRRNSNFKIDENSRSKPKFTEGIKSQFDYDLDCEYESVDDVKDLDFGRKTKKIRYSKSTMQKKKEMIMPISRALLKGLNIYVSINQSYDSQNLNDIVKASLVQVGANIVDDLWKSDVYVSDNNAFILNQIGAKKHGKMKNCKGKPILQILPSQIEWALSNAQSIDSDQANEKTSNGSSVQYSSYSSAAITESSFTTTIADKNKSIENPITSINKQAQIIESNRISFQPSNTSSPALQLPKQAETGVGIKNFVLDKPKQLSSLELMNLASKLPARKKMCNSPAARYGAIASQLSLLNPAPINKNAMMLPSAPQNHSLQIIISDIRHRFAPIFKTYRDVDQIPHLHLDPAPRYYCMNAFQKVPPNADQFAKNYIMKQQAAKNQSNATKIEIQNNAFPVGDSHFCYVCRKSFENPVEHHNSIHHKRQTQPLWSEFDALAASFNDL